ncbi:MAG: FAD-dependent oxidoreductase [Actinomycetota bacterium]
MQPSTPTENLDVLIIGGGLAGLSAARHLTAAGRSVAVIEARGRTGGRSHTHRLADGRTIDLGAQLIGDVQTRVSDLVDEVGLTRVAPNSEGDVLHVPSPGAPSRRLRNDRDGLGALGLLDLLQAGWRSGAQMRKLGTADAGRLDGVTAAEYLRGLTFLDSSYEFLISLLEDNMCVPLDEISAYEVLEQVGAAGGLEAIGASEQWFLAEGTQPIADHLESLLAAPVVHNAPVERLDVGDDGVVAVAGATTYRARHAVVAVPPQFYDALGLADLLDDSRRRALADWVRADVVKTVLVFEAPFWRSDGLSGLFHTPGGFANSTMDCSPADASAGVLVLFSTSTTARQLRDIADEQERMTLAIAWLRELLGDDVPSPVAGRSIDWSGDPWSLGGYASHRGIGGWTSAPDLFTPVGPLHFAGTETADEWRGFMEGALQSGERAAAEILATP